VRGPRLADDDLKAFYAGTKEIIKVPNSRPPLFATDEPPAEPGVSATPTPAGTPAPTTPPVGVAPPPPPVPSPTPVPQPVGSGPAPAPQQTAEVVRPADAAPVADAGAEELSVIFSPPEVPLKMGETRDLSAIVLRVKELVSVDAVFVYDPAAIVVDDVEPGSLLTLDGSTISSEKNLESGRVRVRFARTGPTAKTPSSGAITVLHFHGVNPGPTTITIESLSLITPRGRERVTLPGPGRVVVQP
jgi:hypothetical protein